MQNEITSHTAYITHADCMAHDVGPYHPESAKRLSAIRDHLLSQGIDKHLVYHDDAPLATTSQLERVHDAKYIAEIKKHAPKSKAIHLDPDTVMSPHTLQAALRAAGAGIMAVDLIMKKQIENAFCAVRPPGHHAERSRAMGFCIFNNIAVAAAHALEAYGLERVAIIDFDVHHGNGTENIFTADKRVLMCGIFQHPFYPYSGTNSLGKNMHNVPLPAGSDGEALRVAVQKNWLPQLEKFKPQMLFISAGFDAHSHDDIASLRFKEADYAWCTKEVKEVAKKSAEKRIVSMLEGGYMLNALAQSVASHLRVLADL